MRVRPPIIASVVCLLGVATTLALAAPGAISAERQQPGVPRTWIGHAIAKSPVVFETRSAEMVRPSATFSGESISYSFTSRSNPARPWTLILQQHLAATPPLAIAMSIWDPDSGEVIQVVAGPSIGSANPDVVFSFLIGASRFALTGTEMKRRFFGGSQAIDEVQSALARVSFARYIPTMARDLSSVRPGHLSLSIHNLRVLALCGGMTNPEWLFPDDPGGLPPDPALIQDPCSCDPFTGYCCDPWGGGGDPVGGGGGPLDRYYACLRSSCENDCSGQWDTNFFLSCYCSGSETPLLCAICYEAAMYLCYLDMPH